MRRSLQIMFLAGSCALCAVADEDFPVASTNTFRLHTNNGGIPLDQRVDNWHAWISLAIADRFDRIDRLFGDEIIIDERRRTRLRTGLGVRYEREKRGKMVTDFSLRVALPRLEERWQVFMDELAGEDDLRDIADLTRPPVDTEPDVGLRYFLQRTTRKSVSADAGYRFGSPNQAFGRLRGRVRYPVRRWNLEVTQTGTYYTRDGWRSQSDISWTRPFAEAYGFRSFSRVTVDELSTGYTPEQRFSLYRLLTVRRAWRLEGRGVWQEMPYPSDIRYTVAFTYRQLVHRNWLFVELVPGVEYAEVNDYAANPFVILKFEVVFNAD
ncbi:MAG: hypothetical protein ACNA71_09655 [Kiritimatiellia bacterium]